MTITVRQAARADLKPAAEVLARAFYTDPPMMWLLPDPATRLAGARGVFRTILRVEALHLGGVDVAQDGYRIVGAAIWFPPDAWKTPLMRELIATPGFLVAFRRNAVRASRFQDALVRAHPHEPHWFLHAIGVDPDFQGRQVGAALLRSRLDRCDSDGSAAYLEASKPANADLYERFGFERRGPIQMSGGPALTAMWRTAA